MALRFSILLYIILVIFGLIHTSTTLTNVFAHRCIHDEEIAPMIRRNNPPQSIPQSSTLSSLRRNGKEEEETPNERNAEVQSSSSSNSHDHFLGGLDTDPTVFTIAPGAAPIRINISTLDLFNTSQYCTTIGEFKPDFKGGTLNCTNEASIFTAEKRDALTNILLPRAFEKVQQILNVMPLASAIAGLSADLCAPFTIPQSHIDVGVENSDVVFYVAAGVTVQGNIAWAGMCANDADGRSIVGRMNCGPEYIPTPPLTEAVIDSYARTLIHEAFHALGFSYDIFSNGFNSPLITSPTVQEKLIRGGVPSYEINTSHVVNASKWFYNCSSVTGAELELENGPGTALSHWNRRTLFESVMVGISGRISAIDLLTLSLFADMPYYWVNSSAVEPMYFGNNTQCDLVEKKCTDPTNNIQTKNLFCADRQSTSRACDYSHKAIGQCGIVNFSSALPSYWQYYPGQPKQGGSAVMMEYCPFTSEFKSLFCPSGNLSTGSSAEHIYGYTRGASSRCVEAASLIETGYQPPLLDPTRCLIVKCLYEGCDDPRASTFFETNNCTYRLQIQVRTDPFLDCPVDGSAGVIAANYSFYGNINCPKASDICDPSSRGYGDDLIFERITTTTQAPTSTTSSETATSTTTTAVASSTSTSTGNNTNSTSSSSSTTTMTVITSTTGVSGSVSPPPPPSTTSVAPGSSSSSSSTTIVSTTSTSIDSSSSTTETTTASIAATTVIINTTTTADPNGNNNGAGSLTGQVDPSACFLHNLPCWVSYIIVALAALFVLLIIWWIYKKFCGNNNNNNDDSSAKNKNSSNHQNETALSPVDLALRGQMNNNTNLNYRHPPASPPKGKYELMAEQMKTMSPREVHAAVYNQNSSYNNNNGGHSTPALVSPSARYIDSSMQQISPRQAPIFTDDDL